MKIYQHDPMEDDFSQELASPARRALAAAGIQRLEHLTTLSKYQVSQLHGIGPIALAKLRRALGDKGLSFAKGKREN